MIISGFHLDGFGIYHNEGVQDLGPGLVLFLGDNECGKTTLMEFIRTVLFGWPRRDTRNLYPPLRGGSHGGRLQLWRRDGVRFTIERLEKRVTLAEADGTPEKANPAERLLGGLDRNTFERVFAIGLKDLHGLDLLSQEGVQGRLFSAGAGLGAASLPAAMQTLRKELGNLLIPGGRTQRVHQIIQQLRKLDQDLKKIQGESAEYAAAQKRREELEERLRAAQSEAEDIQRRLGRLDQLQRARGPWVEGGQARDKSKELEFAALFPPDGLERLASLRDARERLSRDLDERREEAAQLKERLGQLTVDEAILGQQENIAALLGETGQLVSALADHPTVKSDLGRAAEEFGRRLRELGTDWDSHKLAQVDTSVQVRQKVQEFDRGLDAAERHYDATLAEERRREEDAALAQSAWEEAQRQWRELPPPLPKDSRELQQQEETVRLLRPLLFRQEVLSAQLTAKLAAREDAALRLAAFRRRLEALPAPWPGWMWIPALAAGVAAAGMLTFYQRAYISAAIALTAGLGVAAFFHLLRRSLRNKERLRLTEDQDQVNQVLTALEAEVENLRKEKADVDLRLDDLAAGAALDRPQDLGQLEHLAGQLENAARQLQEWQSRQRESEKAAVLEREAREKLEKARQEREQAYQGLELLQAQWREWLAIRGFPEHIRPSGFEAVLQAVEGARGAEGNLQGLRQRLARMEDYLEQTRGRIFEVLGACGRTALAEPAGVEDLRALGRALDAALEARRQQQDLATRLQEVQTSLARLAEQKNARETELRDLLHQAGAEDEEDFRRLAASHQEWRDWVRKIEEAEIALRTIAGNPEAQAALEEELSRTDSLSLQTEKELLQARGREMTEAISRDEREVGGLTQRLADLEQNQELGQLLLEERGLKEQLAEAARRWATLTLCRHLLEQARGVYERERQPQVIREADRFLSTMAQDRYRLVASVGEESIQLEDKSSLRRKAELCWSAGLADQVYLAIRLGLAREFSRHGEPLPVILDDVLVKFDPYRRRQAAKVILEFSREQQVLMFSCHPEFREIFLSFAHTPQYRDAQITCFTIADGVITRTAAP